MSSPPNHDTGGAKEIAPTEDGKTADGKGPLAEHYEVSPPDFDYLTIHEPIDLISSPHGLSGVADARYRTPPASIALKANTDNISGRIATPDVSPLFLDNEKSIKKSMMVTPEELTAILENVTIAGDPRELRRAMEPSNKQMLCFLIKNCEEFVTCKTFRDRGWMENKEVGDAHFAAQRAKADQTDDEGERRFYNMMQQIAEEMDKATGVLYPQLQDTELKCLDICMAPGGYTAAVLKHHKGAKCFGITLPVKDGGHPVYVRSDQLAGLKQLDVTMLVNEFMDASSVPKSHPSASKFASVRPFSHYKFDLVFCDGIVLRTQDRDAWRDENEVTRLSRAQMILALQRVAPGGTIAMLLHKIDSWGTADVLYTFSKFSKVQTFKPARKHSSRSSFYMVAKDVQPDQEEAKMAVKDWKEAWRRATFGGEDGTGEKKLDDPESVVREMLENYGERLIEMGRPIWKIQANALSRTNYAGDGSGSVPYSAQPTSITSPRSPDTSRTSPLSDLTHPQGLQSPIWNRNRQAGMASHKENDSGRARSNEETDASTDLVWGRPRQGNRHVKGKRSYENAPPSGPRPRYANLTGGPREEVRIPHASPPKRPFTQGPFYEEK